MGKRLDVYADTYSEYVLVGSLELDDDGRGAAFSYADTYLRHVSSRPIADSLPLGSERFDKARTNAYFLGVLPEGPVSTSVGTTIRVDQSASYAYLESLGDETIGSLVFEPDGRQPGMETYETLPDRFFDDLARSPMRTTARTIGRARLSLPGAMAKVGLYLDPETGDCLLPKGCAPSNVIVKAANGEYPYQVENEALCMRAAALLDLEPAETSIMETGYGPLLVSRRFDRPIPDGARITCGHRRPMRLHQVDMCQELGLPSAMKYDGVGGGQYLSAVASCASRESAQPFGNRLLLFDYLLYSLLVGNCDCHLKNLSTLHHLDGSRELSPLYDCTSTTPYDGVETNLAIRIGGTRSISDLSGNTIRELAEGLSLGRGNTAYDEAADLIGGVVGALEEARDQLVREGHAGVGVVAEKILAQSEERVALLSGAQRTTPSAHFDTGAAKRVASVGTTDGGEDIDIGEGVERGGGGR